jgi:hypothetical protein
VLGGARQNRSGIEKRPPRAAPSMTVDVTNEPQE